MIYQVLPTLSYGDAVGNDAVAIFRLLQLNGYESEIYTDNLHWRCRLLARPFHELSDRIRKTDTVIYHLSTGTSLTTWFQHLNCHKIIIYHNITPPEFFPAYSIQAVERSYQGKTELADLAGHTDLAIADSQYNADELTALGYANVAVVPILMPFDDYKQKPDIKTVESLSDGKTNLLFVGRISPNKRQEDVISAFYQYKANYNSHSRLILAGSSEGMEKYQAQLEGFIKTLGLEQDVVFSGHVSFNTILAYYAVADAFVCMSEHEGFCVPLVEAMLFRVPILARACGAVPETLGAGGLLFEGRNFLGIAESIQAILTQPDLKSAIQQAQQQQLQCFEHSQVEKTLMSLLDPYLKNEEI